MGDGLFLGLVFLAGLTVGSFLNVVIHRGPSMWGLLDEAPRGDLVRPGSYCPSCRMPLRFCNLIPLASFLWQRGRCAACGAPISRRYPLVELLGGAGAVLSVIVFGWTLAAAFAAIAAFALITLAFIDLETGYLPDALTLPLAALGLGVNAFGAFVPIVDALIGAAAGFLVFWAIGAVYRSMRKREGLGLGDAKLLAAIGAWTGWALLPIVIFVAAALTLAVAALRGRASAEEALPFGPGLCAAGVAAIFAGGRLLSGL